MAQLLYKTLGGASPKGKPRVYFACHGEDFRGCFQEITDEILKISGCAIYYYEREPELDEDYYLNLSQMQLIVMPVTSRLLYMPNRAMDVEFPYALAHHIPVLPLMQEQGLEQRYQEKCGDLQFLDKYNSDRTAIPYAEKLKKYLEAVLVGDELAAKVRAAFDAYVFLSYRKKDRKYAQELMRLLHRNPRCRDIAIWYDEFLTPGENFNDSIRDALEKSGLFVLAVTPNLVNEINYIMTTEYPMAKKAGKPILPARMQPTDPDALRASYVGIPDAVDPQDEGVLTDAVLAALRELALRENDADPTHNFLMGLAYLSGIDVEVDHEYAVKLITGAAEAGLTEAMEKLASMYENGEGVKRDYDISVQWRISVVNTLRERYDRSGEETECYAYIDAVKRLIRRLSELRRSAYALEVARKMTDVLPDLVKNAVTEDNLHYVTEGFRAMSELCLEIGEYELASAYYENTCGWAELLTRVSGKVWACTLLADCYRGRGKTALWAKDAVQAQQWYNNAFVTREYVAKQTDLPELWEELSDICDDIAWDYWDYDYYGVTETVLWWKKSAEALKCLYDKCGESRIKQKLIKTYEQIARQYEKNGNQEESQYWKQKIVDILTSQNRETANPLEACEAYIRIAEASSDAGNTDNAMQWYRRALSLVGECASDDNRVRVVDIEAKCYAGMGTAWQKSGDRKKARKCWEDSIVIRERLFAAVGSDETLEALGEGYDAISKFYEKCGCLPERRAYLIKYTDFLEQLIRRGSPDITDNILTVYYEEIGDLYLDEGNEEQALYWYEKYIAVYERDYEQYPEHRDWTAVSLAKGHISVGRSFHQRKKYDKAVNWYIKALEMLASVLSDCPSGDGYEQLGWASRWLGEVFVEQKEFQKAKNCFIEAYKANKWLAKTDISISLVNDGADLCENIVIVCEELKDPEETGRWLEKMLVQIAEVKRRGGHYKPVRDLALAYEKLAEAFKERGDWSGARNWYYRLLELRVERNKANNNFDTRYFLELVCYQLGEVCQKMEMYEEAEKWYKSSFETMEPLNVTCDIPGERRCAAQCCEALTDIYFKKKKLDEAKLWCSKAVDLYAELAKKTKKLSDYESTGKVCYKLGVITKSPQKLRAAQALYSELVKMCPEEPRYKRNAEKISEILKRYDK